MASHGSSSTRRTRGNSNLVSLFGIHSRISNYRRTSPGTVKLIPLNPFSIHRQWSIVPCFRHCVIRASVTIITLHGPRSHPHTENPGFLVIRGFLFRSFRSATHTHTHRKKTKKKRNKSQGSSFSPAFRLSVLSATRFVS